MKLVHVRVLVAAGACLFGALAAAGTLALATAPWSPRPFALSTVASVLAAGALGFSWVRLSALMRHPFRIRDARHVVRFRTEPDPTGLLLVRGRARAETEFETLRDGETRLRLQKFVAEPSSLAPEALLADWNFACRLDGAEAKVAPHLSPSRSLQLDVLLPRPSRTGDRFAVVEELAFLVDPEEQACLVFQPSYPTRLKVVEIVLEDLPPLEANFRIERGLAAGESGPLAPEETDQGRRLRFAWREAFPGEQLMIAWRFDTAVVPELSSTERLIAAARKRQEEVQALLAAQVEIEEGAAGEGETAEEHPIIRRARLREALRSSGIAPDFVPPAAEEAADTTPAEEHPIIKAARLREKLLRGE